MTRERFIQKAIAVHGDRYCYDAVEYQTSKVGVKINCPVHGFFIMRPNNHVSQKQGCPRCGIEKSSESRRYSREDFISRALEIHGSRYDYYLVEYTSSDSKVAITCHIHGMFKQTPNKHLVGQGCPSCAGCAKSTTDQFVAKAEEIHRDRFDYSSVVYVNAFTKVVIGCPKHGNFDQVPHDHLAGKGCAQCKHPISKPETAWLDSMGIPVENRNKVLMVEQKRFVVDGLCLNSRTVFEFYGGYWHGDPKKYSREDMNHHTGCTFGELYDRTMKREQALREAGFHIVVEWE